jgi:hypothetical protein
LLGSSDTQWSSDDDARLDALLRVAKERSGRMGARRRLQRSVAAGVGAAIVVALAATALVSGSQGGTVPGRSAPGWQLAADLGSSAGWAAVNPANLPEFVGSFDCPSATSCYAVAPTHFVAGYAKSPVDVEYSHDGGRTWTSVTLVPRGAAGATLSCVEAMTCAVVVGVVGTGPYDAEGAHVVFFETVDGGRQWRSHVLPTGVATRAESLSCTSALHCVVLVDGKGGVTLDGGVTWETSTVPAAFQTIDGLQCLSSSTCVAVGNVAAGTAVVDFGGVLTRVPLYHGAIARSADGGLTWALVTIPKGLAPYDGLSCANATGCLATFGNTWSAWMGRATVLTSTDGGATWAPMAAAGLGRLWEASSTSCSTSSDCWAAALLYRTPDRPHVGGTFFGTTDAGASFAPAQLPANVTDVSRVSCAGGSCYALAFRTTETPTGKTFSLVLLVDRQG